MEHIITVNKETCIGCNQCVLDCPENNIYLDDNKKATIISQGCMKCGHCSAICPTNSITLTGFDNPPIDLKGIEIIESDKLLNTIIQQRSIRRFKDKKIDKEIIDKIIEAGQWTPTAKNACNVSYVIIEKDMAELEAMAIKDLKKIGIPLEIDDNFLFKKAPIAISIVCDHVINASLAAANMALMAQTFNLGVLYSGFFSRMATANKEINKKMGLDNEQIVTTLVLGYPAVNYPRSTQKDPVRVINR